MQNLLKTTSIFCHFKIGPCRFALQCQYQIGENWHASQALAKLPTCIRCSILKYNVKI